MADIDRQNDDIRQRLLPTFDGFSMQKLIEKRRPEAIDITFKNISYEVKVKKEDEKHCLPWRNTYQKKTILNGVSGVFKAGEVTAILGVSGAGKTTLLNILACRISSEEGELLANNTQYNYKTFGDFAQYVMQKNVLMQTLTVKQTLSFAANLMLNLPQHQKKQKVMELARNMKLDRCLDTLIGGEEIKGISGGEKKRTAIAFALLANPQVIMLDEPTSGLDSLTSFVIIDYLKKLALEEQKTVIMTIHQPNADIYNKFDKTMVMLQGKLIYQGASNKSISYFEKYFNLKCPTYQVAAEFLIAITHERDEKNKLRYKDYHQTYEKKVAPLVLREVEKTMTAQIYKEKVNLSSSYTLGVLLKRDIVNLWRNPLIVKSRLIQGAFTAVFIGGIWFKIGDEDYADPKNMQAITGFIYFYTLSMFMEPFAATIITFPLEREVFLNEQNSRLYSVYQYFISRNITQIPYLLLIPMISLLILYWMVGLQSTAINFFLFYLVIVMMGVAGNSIGMFLGSLIDDPNSVATAINFVPIPVEMFAGLFVNLATIPAWISWIQYTSPLKYGFAAGMIDETYQRPSLISQLNFDMGFWQCIGLMVVVSLVYRMLSLLSLRLLMKKLQ